MTTLVTGANGFVGRALCRRLLANSAEGKRFVFVDTRFDETHKDSRVEYITGSIADSGLWNNAIGHTVDTVYHLASVPGGLAERDYELGRKVNLDATLTLLDKLRALGTTPRLVFASSIAVYGAELTVEVNESTQLQPALSYGTHKLMAEAFINDFARRGWVDGISLRLPGIVARPPEPSGLLSAFMSDVFWSLADGREFVCPVSEQSVAWWMSLELCVDNLCHAGVLNTQAIGKDRALPLPVLRVTMQELVDRLVARLGSDKRALVSYRPNEKLESVFGRFPPLNAHRSEALGFQHDGSVDALIGRVLSIAAH